MKNQFIIFAIILMSIILSDQMIKRYFIKKYGMNTVLRLKNRRYKIYIIKNPGAFLGIFKKYPILVFISGLVLLLILFIYCLLSNETAIKKYALACFASAGLSNIIDRIKYGGVIDYFCFSIFRRNIVINLADIIILCSAIIFVALNYL